MRPEMRSLFMAETPAGPRQAKMQDDRSPAALASEIGQRIVRGDYSPGSILPNEAKWAETFHVSRSVVRETMKMLTAKGLLASRPKIGSRVEPRERWNLLDREVIGWYTAEPDMGNFLLRGQEFRHLVEPEAAAYAALRRTSDDLSVIARYGREMMATEEPKIWMEADIRFHRAIIFATGNELFSPLGVIVEAAQRRLCQFLVPSDISLKEITRLHQAIERAIRLRRPHAARRLMKELLTSTDLVIARKLEGLATSS